MRYYQKGDSARARAEVEDAVDFFEGRKQYEQLRWYKEGGVYTFFLFGKGMNKQDFMRAVKELKDYYSNKGETTIITDTKHEHVVREVLLRLHPDADERRALGCIRMAVMDKGGHGENFCFAHESHAGQWIDFSLGKCFTPATNRGAFSRACRGAVSDIVISMKHEAGVEPYTTDAHHDSEYGTKFSEILKKFVAEYDIDVENPGEWGQNGRRERLKKALREAFRKYHEKHGLLKLMKAEEHRKMHGAC